MENKIRVAITQGDVNGIGYEVIFKTFFAPEILELCTPIIYGSPKAAAYHRKALGIEESFLTISHASQVTEGRVNLVSCDDEEAKIDLGQSTPEAGAQALKALERAMSDYKEGLYDVLVTAPINKKAMQSDTFHFTGHTEYIASKMDASEQPLMILMNADLRVALVTTHLPLKDVPAAITKDKVIEKLRLLFHSLKQDFQLSNPRIAVLSLNPHAGEEGLLGTEEEQEITPAIREAKSEGIQCFGPYPADGFFGKRQYTHFDAVLAMYHDQGLAPFKALAMASGVNFTAGLSLVRTSPAHGTAYDIVGKGEADESSFREAVYAAIDVFRNRQNYATAHRDPLGKIYNAKRDERA